MFENSTRLAKTALKISTTRIEVRKTAFKSSEWNLLKYGFILLTVMHWTACAWGMYPQFANVMPTDTGAGSMAERLLKGAGGSASSSGSSNSDGSGPSDGAQSWIVRMETKLGQPLSPVDKYALALDYSLGVMCMGYGTISAESVGEVAFSIMCMLGG